MLPVLNRVRSWLELPPLAAVDGWIKRMPLLIYLTAEPFEYPRRDWPENVVMVGPCEWDPGGAPPACCKRSPGRSCS